MTQINSRAPDSSLRSEIDFSNVRGVQFLQPLFEDNAEFGMGFRLSADQHRRQAEQARQALRPELGDTFVDALLQAPQQVESEIQTQRERVAELKYRLELIDTRPARQLQSLADYLVRRSTWKAREFTR